MLQRRQQQVMALLDRRDVHRGREGVVGGLAPVDVVVGMDRGLLAHGLAHDLAGPVGDHLVGVHVALGARAGLPDDEREVIVELAADHLAGRLVDDRTERGIERTGLDVHPRRRLLDDAERADQRRRHALAADSEVLQAALGLSAPIGVGRHVDRADRVRLAPGFRRCVGHGRALSGCGPPLARRRPAARAFVLLSRKAFRRRTRPPSRRSAPRRSRYARDGSRTSQPRGAARAGRRAGCG